MTDNKVINNIIGRKLWIFYVVLVLFMPNAISDITTLYHIDASPYVKVDTFTGTHPWLNYSLSFISLISIFAVFFINKTKDMINLKVVLILLVIHNMWRFLFGFSNIFQYNDYAVLLAFLSGYGCYLILTNRKVNMDLEDILDMIIILNFVTQMMFVVTGRQMEYGGRYAALGSGAGAVGEMCSQYLLYYIFARRSEKRNAIVLICCILSLILSGSRTNLLMAILFVVLFSFRIKSGLNQGGNKGKILIILTIVGVIAVPTLASFMENSLFSQVIERMEELLQASSSRDNSYFADDNSMIGRTLSFNAGWGILQENPFGISSSAIDLQLQTLAHGYYSFPHSTLFSFYLMWGVAALLCYAYIIKLLINAIKDKNPCFVLLLSIAIVFVIYGGPIQNAKEFFWYIVLIAYCRKNSLYLSEPIKTN